MTLSPLNIRRIDSRRDDIRAAMLDCVAGSVREATSSARRAGGEPSRSSANR